MTTYLAQNQFISNSGTPPSTAVPDTAAADQVAPQVAAAELLSDFAEALPSSQTAESAVAIQAACPGATAEPFPVSPGELLGLYQRDGEIEPSVTLACAPGENHPSMTMEVNEAPAPRCTEPHEGAGALGTEFIHEIFHYARKLITDAPRFVLDQEAFMADVEEIPLFIREGDQLRRWSA